MIAVNDKSSTYKVLLQNKSGAMGLNKYLDILSIYLDILSTKDSGSFPRRTLLLTRIPL